MACYEKFICVATFCDYASIILCPSYPPSQAHTQLVMRSYSRLLNVLHFQSSMNSCRGGKMNLILDRNSLKHFWSTMGAHCSDGQVYLKKAEVSVRCKKRTKHVHPSTQEFTRNREKWNKSPHEHAWVKFLFEKAYFHPGGDFFHFYFSKCGVKNSINVLQYVSCCSLSFWLRFPRFEQLFCFFDWGLSTLAFTFKDSTPLCNFSDFNFWSGFVRGVD